MISKGELIERHVKRVVVKGQIIEILVVEPSIHNQGGVIRLPWNRILGEAEKGIIHSPLPGPSTSTNSRDVLLTAIAKARAWVANLAEGATSFSEIAKCEGKSERHIRLLAPLAFISPARISNIIDGVYSPVGVTELAKGIPYLWK